MGAIVGVFFLVPRGFVISSPEVNNDIMTSTMSAYTLVADVDIPISNENYLPAQVSGNVSMYYYDGLAGSTVLGDIQIEARSTKQVPRKMLLQCYQKYWLVIGKCVVV